MVGGISLSYATHGTGILPYECLKLMGFQWDQLVDKYSVRPIHPKTISVLKTAQAVLSHTRPCFQILTEVSLSVRMSW